MESENREILDGVTISDVGGSQYMIQRMPVDSQLLSSELLQHHNGLVVDLGAGDFIPVNYASEDLLPQDLTEEDRNLAAALVAVQLSQQQKQQQMQDSNVVINGNLPLCDDQLTDKTTLSNGYLQIVESDNIYKQNLIPKICFDAREFSPAEVYDRNEDILSIKSEKEIESSTAIHRDSDGDQKSDNRNLKRTLPHKKRLSRKLRKTNNALRKFYKCNLCEQVFHNNEDYTRHQSLCQTTITPINQVLFTCQICTASFHDQLRFFEHLKDHYEPSILVQENANCIIDKQTVDVKRQQPTKHQDTILPLYNCIECNKTFRRQKAYEAHVREFHNKDDLHDFSGSEDLIPDIPTPVQPTMDTKEWYHREDELQATEEDLRELEAQDCVCMQCNQQFQTRAALREHAMTCKEMEEVPPLKVPATEGRKSKKKLIEFKCTECTRVFAHKNSLVYHMRVHTGVRPHTCVECGKSFFAAGALKVHLRLHSGDKPYCCEYCGKHFRQWGDLKYHCMSIHSDHKQYQCDYCGKDFARKYSLIVHRRIHTGEKNYKCEFCCKTFRASSYLQNHRRIHTGEKPHCCDMCGKRFRVRSDMKRHLLTHNRKKAGGGGGAGARATPTDPAAVKDEGKEENGIFPDGLPPEDDSMDSKLHSIPSSGIDAPSGGPMQVSQYEQDPLEAIQDNNTLYVMPILIT